MQRRLLGPVTAGLAIGLVSLLAAGKLALAQEYTLKVHQMLPPQATIRFEAKPILKRKDKAD
jgi:hypothetical protein